MNQGPLISIITATYNSDKTFQRTINSIRNQTYKNIEYIVIDGASTDRTVELIKSNLDVVDVWISEKDTGIYDAWNKGIKLAKGEWISFIGSDDEFYPNALADYVSFLMTTNEPDLEFVSSKIHLISSKGILVKTFGWPWEWKKSRFMNTIAHPGALHHHGMFKKYGLFDTNYKICSDYEFLLRPANNFKTAFLNKVTVKMAQGGASFNGRKLYKEQFKVAISTAKVNVIVAAYYYLLHMLKYYIRHILRILGFNI